MLNSRFLVQIYFIPLKYLLDHQSEHSKRLIEVDAEEENNFSSFFSLLNLFFLS